jgi:hypothetical protein
MASARSESAGARLTVVGDGRFFADFWYNVCDVSVIYVILCTCVLFPKIDMHHAEF